MRKINKLPRLSFWSFKKFLIQSANDVGGWANLCFKFFVNVTLCYLVLQVFQNYLRFLTIGLLGDNSEWERIIEVVIAAFFILYLVLVTFKPFENGDDK